MGANKELQIGEIGVRVECMRGGIKCAKKACAFYSVSDNRELCISNSAECCADLRSDHTNVYFKKIEE